MKRGQSMIYTTTIQDVRDFVNDAKKQGKRVGFVPTMGFLHEGHASLIRRARSENDFVIVSDFVNPTQFSPTEDLSNYPRNIENDKQICETAGCDLLFHPDVTEMYPEASTTFVSLTGPSEGLCGASRPTHFRGVCTVVAKLFLITGCERAYFGEKDAQQLAVIKRMVRDLNFPVEIVGCPIVREPDGLAMSSRNTYLSKEQRIAALILSQSLNKARQMIQEGERNTTTITNCITQTLVSEPLARIDYVSIVSFPDIKPVELLSNEILVAIAVYIGKTRLIDNFIWNEEETLC